MTKQRAADQAVDRPVSLSARSYLLEPPQTAEEITEGFTLPSPVTPEAAPGAIPLTPDEILSLPVRHNPTLQRVVQAVNADVDLHAIWRCQNVTAVDRLGMSDHGPVHMHIVANSALRLLRLLVKRGIVPSAVAQHQLTAEDAEVIVVLAALLHDSGMSIQRAEHEQFSLIVALPKLMELLQDIYPPAMRRVVVSEVLHAIIAHRAGGQPLTLEAGVVRVADALDMAKGRSRIPFAAGHVDIHSVSAAAIDAVEIGPGEQKPMRIGIKMNNAAGLFQLDALLKEKLQGSGLESAIEIVADIQGETDKRLFETFRL
jgi:metal-dependent HD superfamily phosphatase/phosphodiesterase